MPKRSPFEQFGMLGAVVVGGLLLRSLPALSAAIGALVALYGTAVLVDFRGMQARFLVPVGIERRPNKATPWITGNVYLLIGMGMLAIAFSRF